MGCISSKRTGSRTPSAVDDLEGEIRVKRSLSRRPVGPAIATTSGSGTHQVFGETQTQLLPFKKSSTNNNREDELFGSGEEDGKKLKGSKSKGSNSNFSLSLRFGSSKSQVVAEQTAAGWPAWLTAVAGEAIHGWVPLRADGFEKLDKIGQGTYSSVFKAREHATGRFVALKKVRFDNYHPESVRFMAREITILRKLDHPNIIKLHGLITSKVSCSIYLVFEYMEHDLSGLLSCPEVSFTEPQIKCFMQQIFYGLDYCHGKGVMHRDIKTSNILLNNDGILKLADFGLANFLMSTKYKQPKLLTSRVVTLWYRPPELLLGSTNYGPYVDMWSAGCVFAELLVGKPILKGKTEVEQLHKIFKLSGSPPDEYWNKSKLPHASRFKPQIPYESSLRERLKTFPEPAINLLEALLSVDPTNRGSAASALNSKYFNTMPYACDPSSLPKYPPSKEIDAKSREESKRKKTGRNQDTTTSSSRMHRRGRKGLPEQSSISMLGRPGQQDAQVNRKYARRNGTNALVTQIRKGDNEASMDMKSDVSQVTNASQGDMMFGGKYNGKATTLALPPKRRLANNDAANSTSKNQSSDPSSVLFSNKMLDLQHEEYEDVQGSTKM
ncbi:probable serine/threonine-protein kinase At1g54610 [Chenopodium quinoa]|uniref:Protein kinase domain-containing protein n=1 Tax=Chenopodium quinoa TaxID=63459 RepID=A0A803LSC8_CHEQI|nr:probable serine/threonine-protein kinase At1g54610 [Chenopodium quinoa]